jgi:protein-S-isoprenylcysteine O-methyltransferase Ste14
MRSFFQGLIVTAWWLIGLFGGSGDLAWRRGWLCTVLYLGALVTCRAVVRRRNPGLLEQRETAIRQDTKPFDRVFLRVFLTLTILQPFVAGLDRRVNRGPMPLGAAVPGIILFTIAASLITWVLIENPHAESSVRIQTDRGHNVVASGPYRLVRHPMYVGLILLHASIALILGSTWNLGLAVVITILFLWRTALEDQVLRRELPGYEEYTAMTRYRIVPGIW